MYYLLVFAMNASTLEPVVLKNCVPYKTESEANVEAVAKDVSRTSRCEKSNGAKSWTCINEKVGVITKITLMTDLKECREFPNESSNKIKKLMGK